MCAALLLLSALSSQVNSAYMNVTISSVCSDGTIYCQLPSRGLTKLIEILEKIETHFHSQVDYMLHSIYIYIFYLLFFLQYKGHL